MLLLLVPAAPASGAAPLEWGIDVKPLQSNMQSIESAVGRSAASTRIFLKWDSAFPDSYHTWLRNSGHKVMISVKPQYLNGTVIKWADVAAAQPGSRLYAELVAWADRIKAFGGSTTFTFHHEPEATANIPFGTATTYKAAWQRVVTLFRSRAVGARFYWIVTANSFRMPSTERRHADKWYPGDAYVDVIASDAYNWFTCRHDASSPWRTLEWLIAPMRDFGAAHPTKPLYLTEYASVEDPNMPGRKAQWLEDARALFKRASYQQFSGIAYFNMNGPAYPACGWPVTSSSSSLAAFKAMGQDPYFAG